MPRIRAGAASPRSRRAVVTRTYDMGRSSVPIDKALRLAADLEDEQLIRKLDLRK